MPMKWKFQNLKGLNPKTGEIYWIPTQSAYGVGLPRHHPNPFTP